MTASGAEKRSVFARYIEDPPTAPVEPMPQATRPEARRLLNWLQNNWSKPTICARDIYRYGPHRAQGRESAIEIAESLVKRGWLIPLKADRRDVKKWQIGLV